MFKVFAYGITGFAGASAMAGIAWLIIFKLTHRKPKSKK